MPTDRTHPSSLDPATSASTGPDQWAIDAASLPLAFAQVREDPRLDRQVLDSLSPGATVVMIASGGETAVEIARRPLTRLDLVDMNPAQLALTRLKLHLATTERPDASAAILGHTPMDPAERRAALQRRLNEIGISLETLGPAALLGAVGPDQAGRYEVTFAELRRELARAGDTIVSALAGMLLSSDCPAAARAVEPGTTLGAALDAAFDRVMSLENLVRLFGAQATQNPRQPFARHFAERTRLAFARFPAAENPFLWQIFAGRFSSRQSYDWFEPRGAVPAIAPAEPNFHRGAMKDVLDDLPAGRADFVHLSNILDWLTPLEASATLRSAHRVLKQGGCVLLRQLNSTVDVERLDGGFVWDTAWGRRLELADRSFFYPALHVGRKT